MAEQKKANRGFFIVIIVALVGSLVIPDMVMKSCQYKPSIPALSDQEKRTAFEYFGTHTQLPEDYVKDRFVDHKGVFLGEFNFSLPQPPMFVFRQNALFVKNLIPRLYEKGIYYLAIEYALAADQKEIDDILTAQEYDQKRVNRVLSNCYALFAYQEYADLFQEAWKINHGRLRGAPAFRIIALNIKIDYLNLLTNSSDPEIVNKALNNTNTVQEDFMYSVIEKEIINPDRKALIFINYNYCIKKNVNDVRRQFYQQYKLEYHGTPASLACEKLGNKAAVVLVHNPWIRNDENFSFPLEGHFDAILRELPQSKQKIGFDLTGSPFEKITVTAFVAPGVTNVPFGDLVDGYIFLGPLSSYEGPTPIANYVTEDNIDELKKFLNPDTADNVTPEKLQELLAQYAGGMTRFAQNLPK
ncbi:MAG: hypothetical protein EHM28_12555 [Spirochaetaceae bacterium]|nr:MAG: hypothetical protein EHM28_12555 [Spirochaetaceae bacterium]